MIDIATANTKSVGIKAARQVSAATIEKVKKFYEYCYGKDGERNRNILERTEEYFINALSYHFQNADLLYSAMPDTETTKYDMQDFFTQVFFFPIVE